MAFITFSGNSQKVAVSTNSGPVNGYPKGIQISQSFANVLLGAYVAKTGAQVNVPANQPVVNDIKTTPSSFINKNVTLVPAQLISASNTTNKVLARDPLAK
jgi:hypothetical protein